jgi:hypothetical protein
MALGSFPSTPTSMARRIGQTHGNGRAGQTRCPRQCRPDSRYAQLNYAVDSIASKAPRAAVYLDGSHSAWLNVGEATYRLTQAGVARRSGLFPERIQLSIHDQFPIRTWLSNCLAYTTVIAPVTTTVVQTSTGTAVRCPPRLPKSTASGRYCPGQARRMERHDRYSGAQSIRD